MAVAAASQGAAQGAPPPAAAPAAALVQPQDAWVAARPGRATHCRSRPPGRSAAAVMVAAVVGAAVTAVAGSRPSARNTRRATGTRAAGPAGAQRLAPAMQPRPQGPREPGAGVPVPAGDRRTPTAEAAAAQRKAAPGFKERQPTVPCSGKRRRGSKRRRRHLKRMMGGLHRRCLGARGIPAAHARHRCSSGSREARRSGSLQTRCSSSSHGSRTARPGIGSSRSKASLTCGAKTGSLACSSRPLRTAGAMANSSGGAGQGTAMAAGTACTGGHCGKAFDRAFDRAFPGPLVHYRRQRIDISGNSTMQAGYRSNGSVSCRVLVGLWLRYHKVVHRFCSKQTQRACIIRCCREIMHQDVLLCG